MRRTSLLLFSTLFVHVMVLLCGCGEDVAGPRSQGSGSGEDKLDSANLGFRQSDPSTSPRTGEPAPLAEWVGNSVEYASAFEERWEHIEREKRISDSVTVPGTEGGNGVVSRQEEWDGVETVKLGRLYVRMNSRPYTGSVIRLYLSGSPQFQATFSNGFRKGIAFWWDANGKLLRATAGWGDDENEKDVGSIANPLESIGKKLTAREPEPNKPIFRGTQNGFDDWNDYDANGLLVAGSTGEVVSGQVKLYGDDGKLESETNYLDGQMHGSSNSYHVNGVKSMKVIFSRGQKIGGETWWSDKGLKTYEANYLNGKLNGTETLWDETGAILSQSRYSNGKKVETIYEQK